MFLEAVYFLFYEVTLDFWARKNILSILWQLKFIKSLFEVHTESLKNRPDGAVSIVSNQIKECWI